MYSVLHWTKWLQNQRDDLIWFFFELWISLEIDMIYFYVAGKSRKSIWRNFEVRNLEILLNILFRFFQRTKLRQPRGQRQLLENKQMLCNISKFRQIAYCVQKKVSICICFTLLEMVLLIFKIISLFYYKRDRKKG